jgi:hypothetical protein
MNWHRVAAEQGPKRKPVWIYVRTVSWLRRTYWDLILTAAIRLDQYYDRSAPIYSDAEETVEYKTRTRGD